MKTSFDGFSRNDLSGILLINKPRGILSHDIVKGFRKLTKIPLVGHAGTLDPMAKGLMVLLLGEGTKLSSYFLSSDKTYQMKIRFGITTDSFDRDGRILSQKNVHLDPEDVRIQLESLVGEIDLQVPHFSATKVKGRKLYDYSRKGEFVKAPVKKMRFYNLRVDDIGKDSLDCQFSCSKGSYVRSWAHDLGEKLKCGAILEELTRLRSEPYSLDDALDWNELKEKLSVGVNSVSVNKRLIFLLSLLRREESQKKAFIPLKDVFPHWRTLSVTGRDEKLMMNGQVSHNLNRRLILERKQADQGGESVGIKVISLESGTLLSLLQAVPCEGVKIRNCFHQALNE